MSDHSDLLSKADVDLISTRLPKVTGWLDQDAAYFTAYLMNRQLADGQNGPALEFGVYHGKYLCLLLHLEAKRDGWVGGYDLFDHCHQETAWGHAETIFGSRSRMALWPKNTRTLTKDNVLADLGHKPRLISVDGDHSADGAYHDLCLAAEVLMERGVIALDDMFNVMAIGVSEGAYRFLLNPKCDFVPFAYVCNKMFLCRREDHRFYLDTALGIVRDFPDLGMSSRFLDIQRRDPSAVVQHLVGSEVAIFDFAS